MPAIPVIGLIVAAAGTTYSVANSEDQKRKASNSAEEQKRLQQQQRNLQDAKNRREARIKSAMLQSKQGGYGGTIYDSASTSIESGADFTSSQIDIQSGQDALTIQNNLESQLGTANSQIGSSVGSFINTGIEYAKAGAVPTPSTATPLSANQVPSTNVDTYTWEPPKFG